MSNREVRGCGAIDAPVQVWVDHSAGCECFVSGPGWDLSSFGVVICS